MLLAVTLSEAKFELVRVDYLETRSIKAKIKLDQVGWFAKIGINGPFLIWLKCEDIYKFNPFGLTALLLRPRSI